MSDRPSVADAPDLTRFASGRCLGLRPRQHALSAPHEPVHAGRQAHPRLCRPPARHRPGRGAPGAEGLLPALRHDAARADGGARHRAGRLPRICPRHRPFGGRARPAACRGHRAAAGAQVHPHQRLAERMPRRWRTRLGIPDHFEEIFDIVCVGAAAQAQPRDLRPLRRG